jgi:hypothetical protein
MTDIIKRAEELLGKDNSSLFNSPLDIAIADK